MAQATRLRWLFGCAFSALIALAALVPTGQAAAQVTLDRYMPAPLPSDGFMLSRPEAVGHLRLGFQIQLDYARDPLVWERNIESFEGGRYSIVQDQLVVHPAVSLGLWNRLLVFAQLPINAVVAHGDDVPAELQAMYSDPTALGKFTLGARFHIFGSRSDPIALGAQAAIGLPIGRLFGVSTEFGSETKVTGHLAGLAELHLTQRLRVGATVGVLLRDPVRENNLDLSSELNFVVGAGYLLIDDEDTKLEGMFEVFGSSLLSDNAADISTPLEALLGAKLRFDTGWTVGAAADLGLTTGYGSPVFRVIGMLGWVIPEKPEIPDRDKDGIPDAQDQCPDQPEDVDGVQDQDGCPDLDRDGDGIDDDKDKCPSDPEDKDQFEDEDGCPDPDNDKDGILDDKDKCPNEAEDKDGYQDEDGCFDPDNDQDGILDTQDKCPNEAEDPDGFQDADGCPDPDNDGDSIPDDKDKCPNEAETKNGKDDDDGCPDSARIETTQIVTLKPVRFATNSTEILRESEEMLREVAAIVIAHPEIELLSVEGHTDSSGNAAANLKLSAGRAASVRGFLINAGVAPERVISDGLGDTQPIADNATKEGRTKNRRVQFNIVPRANN